MDTVFEALLFLAIGLIAITVTVFVLAVSLLGRAIKMSLQEQKEAEEKGKKETEEEIKRIQDKLEESKTIGRVDVEKLRNDLKDLEKKQQKHQKKLNWIKTKPSLLKVDGGVLLPGSFFIISIIFSVLARFELAQNPQVNVLGYCIGSVGLILFGIYILIQSLKVIESVAITSEETAFTRQKDMFKSALIEFETEKSPILGFDFSGAQPPFNLTAGSEMVIEFEIHIVRGKIARKIGVFFYAPPSFDFPGLVRCLPSKDEKMVNYIGTEIEMGEMISGVYKKPQIKIKAPITQGSYKLFWALYCEGSSELEGEFVVKVE